MKKSFFQHYKCALALIIIGSILIIFDIVILITYIVEVSNGSTDTDSLLFLLVLLSGFLIAGIAASFSNPELDIITISSQGIETKRWFKKTKIDWEYITGFGIEGKDSQGFEFLNNTKVIVIHARRVRITRTTVYSALKHAITLLPSFTIEQLFFTPAPCT